MTDAIIAETQQLFESGEIRSEVTNALGIKINTLGKAIAAGRLIEKLKEIKQK